MDLPFCYEWQLGAVARAYHVLGVSWTTLKKDLERGILLVGFGVIVQLPLAFSILCILWSYAMCTVPVLPVLGKGS